MPGAIHRASSDSKSCKRRQSVVGLSTLDIFSCQMILPHVFAYHYLEDDDDYFDDHFDEMVVFKLL